MISRHRMMVKMRDDIERWLIHEGISFEETKSKDNVFQILAKHAVQHGIPVEMFEPVKQPGVLVVGAKIVMKNNQIARYLGFSDDEKRMFEEKIRDYCSLIQAVHKMITEDGKQKIGVYVVLDGKEGVNQQGVFDAMDRVSEMHEKVTRFLLKTF